MKDGNDMIAANKQQCLAMGSVSKRANCEFDGVPTKDAVLGGISNDGVCERGRHDPNAKKVRPLMQDSLIGEISSLEDVSHGSFISL